MDDLTNEKIKNLNEELQEIKDQLSNLPDVITTRLNETIDLKIKVSISELERRFWKWIVGLSFGLIATLGGLVINYIIQWR